MWQCLVAGERIVHDLGFRVCVPVHWCSQCIVNRVVDFYDHTSDLSHHAASHTYDQLDEATDAPLLSFPEKEASHEVNTKSPIAAALS